MRTNTTAREHSSINVPVVCGYALWLLTLLYVLTLPIEWTPSALLIFPLAIIAAVLIAGRKS